MSGFLGCLLHCHCPLRHLDRPPHPRRYVGRRRRRPLLPVRAEVREALGVYRLEEGRRANVLLTWNLLGWTHDVWIIQ
jgi:hypothetical protein